MTARKTLDNRTCVVCEPVLQGNGEIVLCGFHYAEAEAVGWTRARERQARKRAELLDRVAVAVA